MDRGTAITAAIPTCSRVPTSACASPPPSRSGDTLRIVPVRKSHEKALSPRIVTETRIHTSAVSAIRKAVQTRVVASRSTANRRPSTRKLQTVWTSMYMRYQITRLPAIPAAGVTTTMTAVMAAAISAEYNVPSRGKVRIANCELRPSRTSASSLSITLMSSLRRIPCAWR